MNAYHELVHVRRGDIYAGKLQLVAQIVWWFHPLVWWANREACRERERCCDEEVVSGVGCRPVLYARALLSVLERKRKLRSLVAIPGVRALEVTSIRLESIIKYAEIDQRQASLISRLAFAAAAVLLVPGAGWFIQADPPADVDPGVATASVVGALAGDVRVVAIDHRGETVSPVRTRNSGVSELPQVEVEFDIAPSQIRVFRFQFRPFEWAQFDEVALEPGG